MPELVSQKRHRSIKKSRVSTSKSLEVKFPKDPPSTEVWGPKNLLVQTALIQTVLPFEELTWSDTTASNPVVLEIVISSAWGKEPFTQKNLLDNEVDQVREIILRIKTSSSISYRETLAKRLFTLFYDEKEEDPDSIGIAVDSLLNFFIFLESHASLKYPSLSLTPDNNIYASWRGEPNQVFSILFLSNWNASFVIFKPNERHPERKIRISGTATTDILIETISSYGVREWIFE